MVFIFNIIILSMYVLQYILQKLDLMKEKKCADQTKLALHETIGRTDFTPDIVLIEPFSTSKDDTPKS